MTEMTANQRIAFRRMIELERCYGRDFLHKSLHQVRFDYQALERVAKGIDEDCAQLADGWRP